MRLDWELAKAARDREISVTQLSQMIVLDAHILQHAAHGILRDIVYALLDVYQPFKSFPTFSSAKQKPCLDVIHQQQHMSSSHEL